MGILGYYERATSQKPTCQKLAFQSKIVIEMLAQLCSDDSIQILLIYIEEFVQSYQRKTGQVSPR